MATAGQLRARQLPIVEVVVTATSSSTKFSKPLSLLLFSSRLPSALSNPATGPAAAAGIPPSAEPVRRRRQWPRRTAVHVARPPPASQEVVNMTPPYAPSLAEQVLVVVPERCTIAWWRLQGDL